MIHLCVTPTYCLFVCESRGVLPQPSISVSPGGVIPVGGNVTIWCWHQHLGLTFLLYKDEDRNYLAHTDTAGSEAEFPITSARREHGGNYTCRYHDKSGIYSEASDPVQIIVAELSSPKPSIFLRPSEGITLGGAVTVQCQGRHQNMRFLLYKVGNQNLLQDAEPAGDVAEFPIRNVSRRHGGNYHCSYRSKSDRPVQSEPSDPVELVVAGEEPGSASPLPKPPWVLPPDVLRLPLSLFSLPAWDVSALSQTCLPATNTDPGLNYVPQNTGVPAVSGAVHPPGSSLHRGS
uniref:Immunoglobulin domain-containing protein n=1 Tax=Chrysemys picta bellii TaxID=8478 RepID=A0A8C3HTE5_CHRPI